MDDWLEKVRDDGPRPYKRAADERKHAFISQALLSPIEQRIFELLQQNHTEQAIARITFRSPEMIHRSMLNIYRKCLADQCN